MPAGDKMVATDEFRFIPRQVVDPIESMSGNVSTTRVLRILQQKWVVDAEAWGVAIHNPSQYDEWRDIPFVDIDLSKPYTS